MEAILYTKNENLTVKTVYLTKEAVFATVLEYPNGEIQVVETFSSVLRMMEIHDFWCKFTGITSTSFNPSQVEKHLTRIARTA